MSTFFNNFWIFRWKIGLLLEFDRKCYVLCCKRRKAKFWTQTRNFVSFREYETFWSPVKHNPMKPICSWCKISIPGRPVGPLVQLILIALIRETCRADPISFDNFTYAPIYDFNRFDKSRLYTSAASVTLRSVLYMKSLEIGRTPFCTPPVENN